MAHSKKLLFSVDEQPPFGLSVGLAMQTTLIIVAAIVLTPAIVMRAADMPEAMLPQVIFLALVVSGLVTILQALRLGRFGSGHILLMGTSGAFIAAGVAALQAGGLPLLMTLIAVSSSIQFLLAAHLGAFRRVITPLIGGTTLMLLAVTVMPVAFSHFESEQAFGVPVAGMTLLVMLLMILYGGNRAKLWAPVVGIAAGTLLHVLLGEPFDFNSTSVAFGYPQFEWQGLDLSFNLDFWLLLPTFVIVTIVGALETYGDAIAIQEISGREDKAADYGVVQGAMNADGVGNLLSGLLGTLPCTTYSTSISVVDMTGVGSRRVGWICGGLLVLLGFSPFFYQLILAIPQAVVGAYLLVLIAMLFVHGVKMVTAEPLTTQDGLIMGLGFWLGMGFQQRLIFAESIPEWLLSLTDNGMTVGALIAMCLMMLTRLRRQNRKNLTTQFGESSIQEVHDFVIMYASSNGWESELTYKAQLATEEALSSLMSMRDPKSSVDDSLRVELRYTSEGLEIDIVVARSSQNISDVVRSARDMGKLVVDQMSFRILDQVVDDVRHLQFRNTDYICLKIR